MKRILIIGVGISDVNTQNYGQDAIDNNIPFKKYLNQRYEKIIYFKYQDILDKHAVFAKTLLDPARFVFKVKAQKEILNNFERLVKRLQAEGYIVDLFAHSLFCWVSAKAKVELDTVIHAGSPIGWITPGLRFIVRFDICKPSWVKPALSTNHFFNLYSVRDPVGNKPNFNANPKWAFQSKVNLELHTNTTHNWNEYVDYLYERRFLLL